MVKWGQWGGNEYEISPTQWSVDQWSSFDQTVQQIVVSGQWQSQQLSDQYPAHNIQIFSHRFSSEFCISFKHKLIHLLSQFTVSFLLHCYNVVAFSWSFSQWNKASEIGMRLCTWLVFSPTSPRSLLPLLPSFHLLLVKNVQHSWQSHPPRVELDTWWITRH